VAVKTGSEMGFKDFKRLKLLEYTGDTASSEVAEAKKFWKDRY
jgi:hypothetical protein